jgi:hypothetical protein
MGVSDAACLLLSFPRLPVSYTTGSLKRFVVVLARAKTSPGTCGVVEMLEEIVSR